MTANDIIECLLNLHDDEQRKILLRFFKTGPGEYGEGDEFLGIRVPNTRLVAKEAREIPLTEIPALLTNRFHEVRLCGFLILTYKMERLCRKKFVNAPQATKERDAIIRIYLKYANYANNWDLVDLSAPKIIGPWLLLPSEIADKDSIMDSLIESSVLWRQRIAMVSTWKTTQQGQPDYALRYAERLVYHKHDLMHKAVGWMLREVGKRCSKDMLEDFLEKYAATMPRTALRYAIEKFPLAERQYWMTLSACSPELRSKDDENGEYLKTAHKHKE